jgi:hypothetical protein
MGQRQERWLRAVANQVRMAAAHDYRGSVSSLPRHSGTFDTAVTVAVLAAAGAVSAAALGRVLFFAGPGPNPGNACTLAGPGSWAYTTRNQGRGQTPATPSPGCGRGASGG